MQFSDIKLAAKNLTVTLLPHTESNTGTTNKSSQPTESVLTPDPRLVSSPHKFSSIFTVAGVIWTSQGRNPPAWVFVGHT